MRTHCRRVSLRVPSITLIPDFSSRPELRFQPPSERTADETPGFESVPGHSGWPQFAHDHRNTSYNPDATGPLTDVEIAWTNPLNGTELFDPVVTDAVYVTESDSDGTVYRLDGSDGSVIWKNTSLPWLHWPAATYKDRLLIITRTSDAFENPEDPDIRFQLRSVDRGEGTQIWETEITASMLSHPPIAPTVAGDRVFVASQSGIVTLDAETGTKQWSKEIHEGIWATPTVRGEFVYTLDRRASDGTERHVYALDRETGERRWTRVVSVPHSQWSKYNIHVVAGDRCLFVLISGPEPGSGMYPEPADCAGQLFVLDPTSGDVRWTKDFEGTTGVPAFTGDILFISAYDPVADTDCIHAINIPKRQIEWTQTCGRAVGAVAATDNMVYANGDGLEAIDSATGERLWQKLPGCTVGSPVVSDDTVYATYNERGDPDEWFTRIAAFHEQ